MFEEFSHPGRSRGGVSGCGCRSSSVSVVLVFIIVLLYVLRLLVGMMWVLLVVLNQQV